MKAIVYTQYGSPDVLQLREVPRPEPGAGQVLVRVFAASVNALDYRRFAKLSFFGRFVEEKVLKSVGTVIGADIAGKVHAIGAGATHFKPGDEVFGVAAGTRGGFAQYACAAEGDLAPKPARLSFEAAAAAPVAAVTALQCLRDKARVGPGQKVLVYGASGGVGTFMVQIAKSLGAEVTAVCSGRNRETARSIGADRVVDYEREDYAVGGARYDAIVVVNGDRSIFGFRRSLRRGGVHVAVGGSLGQILLAMLLGPLVSRVGGRKVGFMGVSRMRERDLAHVGELLAAGRIKSVIDRSFPLGGVPDAIRYLAEGHAKGKVVITVEDGGSRPAS